MVSSKRASAAFLLMVLAGLLAWGCGSSARDFAPSAGAGGMSEAGASDGGAATHAGASNGGASEAEAGAGGVLESEGGSAGEAGTGGGEVPDPRAPFVAWDAARITVECQKDLKCGRIFSVVSCAQSRGQSGTYDQFFGGADLYGDQLATYALADAATQKACLDGIAASACADPNPASCAKVLVPLAPRAFGASCRSPSPYLPARPCVAGYTCSREGQCPVCIPVTPPKDVGVACKYDDECQSGLTCKATGNNTYTCQARSALGGKCEFPNNCVEGTCVAGTCKAYVLQNGACSATAVCLSGLVCGTADSKCHPDPAPKLGEACTRHVTTAAQTCPGWCVFPNAEAAIGVCAAPPAVGPSPCTRYSGGSQLYCQSGTYADTHGQTNAPDNIPDYCECLPKNPAGTPCTNFQQCSDGRCAPVAGGSVCAARLAAGEACTSAPGECESYSCNDTSHVCDPVTSCAP